MQRRHDHRQSRIGGEREIPRHQSCSGGQVIVEDLKQFVFRRTDHPDSVQAIDGCLTWAGCPTAQAPKQANSAGMICTGRDLTSIFQSALRSRMQGAEQSSGKTRRPPRPRALGSGLPGEANPAVSQPFAELEPKLPRNDPVRGRSPRLPLPPVPSVETSRLFRTLWPLRNPCGPHRLGFSVLAVSR